MRVLGIKEGEEIAYFNNKRISHDGIQFRSKDEVHFWEYLKRQKEKELIRNFEYESESFVLIPAFKFLGTTVRAITYCPDFTIYHNDGGVEYIETKGMLTNEATLKIKMFKYHLNVNLPEAKYQVLSRNLTHGDIDGEWIDYYKLKKIRAANKKKKKEIE